MRPGTSYTLRIKGEYTYQIDHRRARTETTYAYMRPGTNYTPRKDGYQWYIVYRITKTHVLGASQHHDVVDLLEAAVGWQSVDCTCTTFGTELPPVVCILKVSQTHMQHVKISWSM